METILVVVHLFLAIGLVGLILIQQGKGADMGAAFGSGASASVFGSRGAANFLSRSTAILATLFFVTSLALAYFAINTKEPESVVQAEPVAIEQAPVAPVTDLPDVPDEAIAPGSDLPAISE